MSTSQASMARRLPKSRSQKSGAPTSSGDGAASDRRGADRRQTERRSGFPDNGPDAIPMQSLALQLASQIPPHVLKRLPEGTQVRDLIYALEAQVRLIGFLPALPVTVVASADGHNVFVLQGALGDPNSLRASVCVNTLRPISGVRVAPAGFQNP